MSFRGSFWHELGHSVFNWRFENKQYVWRGGEAFVLPWVNRATNGEALRFERRTQRQD
jgi:galactose mutarotase-like enzyme